MVVDYGYDGDEVTFLAVQSWPASTPASERARDHRFNIMDSPPTYRDPSGARRPISATPHVYFFDGSQLTSFPVDMTEDDLDDVIAALDGNGMTDYRKLLPLIRHFEMNAP